MVLSRWCCPTRQDVEVSAAVERSLITLTFLNLSLFRPLLNTIPPKLSRRLVTLPSTRVRARDADMRFGIDKCGDDAYSFPRDYRMVMLLRLPHFFRKRFNFSTLRRFTPSSTSSYVDFNSKLSHSLL